MSVINLAGFIGIVAALAMVILHNWFFNEQDIGDSQGFPYSRGAAREDGEGGEG